MQVLTHPVWWQKTVMTPRARVARCIDGRSQKLNELYDTVLENCGRENIEDTPLVTSDEIIAFLKEIKI